MDRHRMYEEYFKDALELDILYLDYPHDKETLEGILDLLVETCCLKRKEVRVADDDKPVEVVKNRLMKLNSMHIQYLALYNAYYDLKRVCENLQKELNRALGRIGTLEATVDRMIEESAEKAVVIDKYETLNRRIGSLLSAKLCIHARTKDRK